MFLPFRLNLPFLLLILLGLLLPELLLDHMFFRKQTLFQKYWSVN